jgi:hypothetical protein
MKLLQPHKTSRTSMGQTLQSILVEVLLCIGLAMVLAVCCQPEDTCYECFFVLTGRVCFAEVVVTDAAATRVSALRAHVPAMKVFYCPLQLA